MKYDNDIQNPWAGLSSYEDPAKSEFKLKFCGRDNETKEVVRLIDDNFFVTLYGKSGIGKTSLLNAGVFPTLRREQYTPLSLRLGMTEVTTPFQEVITQAIERAIEEVGGSIYVISVLDEQTEQDSIDYLWCWFARRRFVTANGQITFPVLVFDQFEEVLRYKDSRKKTKVLLEQLNFLIDESHAIGDCVVDGEEYNYDFNFRFVLSIREDDLYRLEDSLDKSFLPSLKRCRYRLHSLSEQGARDAILIPGEGLFNNEERDLIANKIILLSQNVEDESIGTNALSLICYRLFITYLATGKDIISMEIVDKFVESNPFEGYYFEVTQKLKEKERKYIENNLVDCSGRRNSISEFDFCKNVPHGQYLLCGDTKILQRISISSNSTNDRVELIHDSFCDILIKQKTLRMRTFAERIALFVVYTLFYILLFQVIPFTSGIRSSWHSIMVFTPLLLPFILPIVTMGYIRHSVPIVASIVGCIISLLPFTSLFVDEYSLNYCIGGDIQTLNKDEYYEEFGNSILLFLCISVVLFSFFLYSIVSQKRYEYKEKKNSLSDRVKYSYFDLFVSPTNRKWLFLFVFVFVLNTSFNIFFISVNPRGVFLLASLIILSLFEPKSTRGIWIIAGSLLFVTMLSFASVTICFSTYITIAETSFLNIFITFAGLFVNLRIILPELSKLFGWKKHKLSKAFVLYFVFSLLFFVSFSDIRSASFSLNPRTPLSLYNYMFLTSVIGIYIYKYSSIIKRTIVFFLYSFSTLVLYSILVYGVAIKDSIIEWYNHYYMLWYLSS